MLSARLKHNLLNARMVLLELMLLNFAPVKLVNMWSFSDDPRMNKYLRHHISNEKTKIPLYYHGERFPNKTKSAFNLFIKLFMARITYNMHRVIKCRSHTGKRGFGRWTDQ